MAVATTPVDDGAIDGFREGLHGELLRPGDSNYDETRAIWNGMIDKRPALIARAMGVSDVIAAVDFAREQEMLLAVRGAGHNIAGNAVCDDGLMLDLSAMRSVRVDPAERTARVEPGATLGDFDHEAQTFGLATPTGINSTTGVAGLTLGGGFGWLARRDGMTVDNLRSVDIVTADGELRHASETENADLFWGIRGGGGNFGVVTSFEFDLHEVGPEILSGPIVYAGEDARDVIRHVRDFNEDAPDEAAAWIVLRKAPPLPFLPEAVHGVGVVLVVTFYAGDMTEGEEVLAPLREYGDPIADAVGPHQYAAFQQSFDPLLTEGVRNYWKSHNFSELSDEAIDTAVEHAADLPSPLSEIFFGQLGGAMARVPSDATAYPHRDAKYAMNVHTRWEDPAMDEECIAWSRAFFDAMAPYATGGVYVNFISEDEGEETLAYGANHDRLAEIKAEYDPGNLFRMNQNVEPAR
ncbi:FAD-binding oxidoreductase [Natrinema longum]|uniref:FAD-binding oxidoreductase n=1 Tax=Natrinema longum TaxID=370324 RepID=A0A8A2UA75_9EURY|nr:FAD-binding oxidoreductase [Natrinema longum]MBZ6496526.1 FAD-binding oxidoreductase [Natrinema longum]QSW85570.1 FAD-binding oxidoreductase [Natrinema longum]